MKYIGKFKVREILEAAIRDRTPKITYMYNEKTLKSGMVKVGASCIIGGADVQLFGMPDMDWVNGGFSTDRGWALWDALNLVKIDPDSIPVAKPATTDDLTKLGDFLMNTNDRTSISKRELAKKTLVALPEKILNRVVRVSTPVQ